MTEDSVAERNKQLAMHAFAEFAAGNIDILRTVLREDFVEHSPGNPSGREAFIEFIASAPVGKARELNLKRVIADDQYVVMHYEMILAGDDRGVAVVDLWRMQDGLIVEHWDVVQPVPGPELVPHGMF